MTDYSVTATPAKRCRKCGAEKPFDDFYKRPHIAYSKTGGHLVSECKICMKTRSADTQKERLSPLTPRAAHEIIAIEALHKQGIPAIPGKAVSFADVDVLALGCVRIEVKYSAANEGGVFRFSSHPLQQKRGWLADVVLLICEYAGEFSLHLFDAFHPVFYIKQGGRDWRVKSAVEYVSGRRVATRHGSNRAVLLETDMLEARDNWQLVHSAFERITESLRAGTFDVVKHAQMRTLEHPDFERRMNTL